MSNYLFYTLLGYAAGLITSMFIEVSIDKRYQRIEERMWRNAKAEETE